MAQILQRKPHADRPGRLWAVHRLRAAKPGYDSKVYSVTIQATESNGGYQTFHLLCMSFLAVLLLEEARHWSHLTGTSTELLHLNYSLYMRAISFKGTDVSLLPPCCQIKGSVDEQWPDTSAFSWI